MNYGNIYCSICKTYVYDEEIDSISKEEADKASQLKCMFLDYFLSKRPQLVRVARYLLSLLSDCIDYFNKTIFRLQYLDFGIARNWDQKFLRQTKFNFSFV